MSERRCRVGGAGGTADTKAGPILPARNRYSANAVQGGRVSQQSVEDYDSALPRTRTYIKSALYPVPIYDLYFYPAWFPIILISHNFSLLYLRHISYYIMFFLYLSLYPFTVDGARLQG